MHVQLGHKITECRDVQLVRPEHFAKSARQQRHLFRQRQPIGLRQLKYFACLHTLRKQDEPRISDIVHHQQQAESQPPEHDGIRRETRM